MTYSTPMDERPEGPTGQHLDEVTAMRIADGETVAPPVTSHATRCVICAALIAALRVEGQTLAAAFALDKAELSFLARAQVPAQVAAVAAGQAQFSFLHVPRDTPASLLAISLVALGGYVSWWLAQPSVEIVLQVARRSGVMTVAAGYVTSWTLALMWSLWGIFQAMTQVPVIDSPTLPLLALTAVVWLVTWLLPHPRTRVVQQA